jgi:two-component system, cell cycle sensor histidine kinase and response regulator CckA
MPPILSQALAMKEPEKQQGDQRPLPASEPTTILVVDDDALIRTMLDFYLGAFGYRVLLASNGEEAVQIARDHPEIRLAILDVVMSGLCGQKLADKLALALPGVAILFSSGHPASSMSRHGIDLRSAHFLQKPCLPPELKCKLEEMLVTR